MKRKRLRINYEQLRKAEALCAQLQHNLHNLHEDSHALLKFAKGVYKEIATSIRLAATEYTTEEE